MKATIFEKGRKQAVTIFSIIVVLLVCFTAYRVTVMAVNNSKTTLVVYDGPSLIKQSEAAKISVNDKALFVYNVPVNNSHAFVSTPITPKDYSPMSYFDFDGKVNIKITVPNVKSLTGVVVRPLSSGITPKVDGNT